MKKFERVSLVDGAVAELEGEIRSGRWPVGTRIPPESQLVEQLGMSRTPVREAVRSLVQSGCGESPRGRHVRGGHRCHRGLRFAGGSRRPMMTTSSRCAMDSMWLPLASRRPTGAARIWPH